MFQGLSTLEYNAELLVEINDVTKHSADLFHPRHQYLSRGRHGLCVLYPPEDPKVDLPGLIDYAYVIYQALFFATTSITGNKRQNLFPAFCSDNIPVHRLFFILFRKSV